MGERKKLNLLTQKQIEENIFRRAEEVAEKVRRLEWGSRCTQATIDLEFYGPGKCGRN